jgi:hypothetical protein
MAEGGLDVWNSLLIHSTILIHKQEDVNAMLVDSACVQLFELWLLLAFGK